MSKTYALDLYSPNYIRLDINIYYQQHCQELIDIKRTNQLIEDQDIYNYNCFIDQEQLIRKIANYSTITPYTDRLLIIDPSQIMITHGSDNALYAILQMSNLLASNKPRIAVLSPTYPHFIQMAKTLNFIVEEIPVLDINKVKETIEEVDFSKYDLAYLVTPNMPLGYIIPNDIVIPLLSKYPNTRFIIDEAYHEYGNVDCKADILMYDKSVMDQSQYMFGCKVINLSVSNKSVSDQYSNLFITRTFSKAFGMAGLRLGYCISTNKNIEQLKLFTNSKDVSSLAIKTANIILDNQQHYLNNAAILLNLREYIASRLDTIIADKQDVIYSYNIQNGNFFLIFTHNNPYVVSMCRKYGYIIRDKSSDIPDAIRVSLCPKEYLDDLFKIWQRINLSTLIKKASQESKLYIDLDDTIRDGSRPDSPLLLPDFIKRYNFHVITNLNLTEQTIYEWFAMQFPNSERVRYITIISSITRALRYLEKNIENKNISIFLPTSLPIESQRIVEYFQNNGYTIVDKSQTEQQASAIILATIDLTVADLVILCNTTIPIIYLDDNLFCTFDTCTENLGIPKSKYIPDMGSIIKTIKECNHNCQLINVGKSNYKLDKDNGVMIGNAETDAKFAATNNLKYIQVAKSFSNYMPIIKNNYYITHEELNKL